MLIFDLQVWAVKWNSWAYSRYNWNLCSSYSRTHLTICTCLRCWCYDLCGGRWYYTWSSNLVSCYIYLELFFLAFCVVIWFFTSPPQRPMTSDWEGFSIPDFIHYIYFPILIPEKEPVFPFSMLSAKQGNYWYHFYNAFGMTRSLTGDWTRDLPHSKPALYY